MPKKKGKKGKKKKSKVPKMSDDEIRSNLKSFMKMYTESAKKYETTTIASIYKKAQKLSKAEEKLKLVFDLTVKEEIDMTQLSALLDVLNEYKHYERLNFWKAGLGDRGAEVIGDWLRLNCHLKYLQLLDCRISMNGMGAISKALQHNETLTHLCLDYNELGDQGAHDLAVGLSWNPKIEYLSLRYCNISGGGAASIANEMINKSTSLIELDLQGNPLGPAGVSVIGESLKTCKVLQKLNLSDTSFGFDPAAVIALSVGIQENTSLTQLSIHLNSLDVDAVPQLQIALKENKTLKSLTLYEFQPMEPAVFKDLKAAVKENAAKKKKKKGKKGKKKKKKKK